MGSIPGGKIPWRREWLPTPILLPREFHGQRSLASYSPWGHKELDTTERITFPFYLLDLWGCKVPLLKIIWGPAVEIKFQRKSAWHNCLKGLHWSPFRNFALCVCVCVCFILWLRDWRSLSLFIPDLLLSTQTIIFIMLLYNYPLNATLPTDHEPLGNRTWVLLNFTVLFPGS